MIMQLDQRMGQVSSSLKTWRNHWKMDMSVAVQLMEMMVSMLESHFAVEIILNRTTTPQRRSERWAALDKGYLCDLLRARQYCIGG